MGDVVDLEPRVPIRPAVSSGQLPARAASPKPASPHSSAEQYDWPLFRLQNETSARRANVESVTYTDVLSQVISSRSIRLDLDTNSIMLCREWARERVAAKKCRATVGPLQAHDHVLAWQSSWELMTVGTLHGQRKDVHGLVIDCRYYEPLKSWCNRMRGRCRREPRVSSSRRSCLALQ